MQAFRFYVKLTTGCAKGVHHTPKIGCFFKMFKIQLFCRFFTQLVKKRQQWSLYEVMGDTLLFVLNTKQPLSDIWLINFILKILKKLPILGVWCTPQIAPITLNFVQDKFLSFAKIEGLEIMSVFAFICQYQLLISSTFSPSLSL